MAETPNPFYKHMFSMKMRLLACVVVGGVTPSSLASATVADSDHAVTPTIEIDRPVILDGDMSPIFVMIRLEATELSTAAETERPPLNLSLVLDRSGSMDDKGKMDYLKQAAKMAVDRLNTKDHLAIVEYDDDITVMWPSQPVDSTFPIKRLIDELSPRGSTNLVGGMMRGADEVLDRMKKMEDADALNRVLLLSDGLANEGVTEPSQIRRLVRSAKNDGVRISTMGLGRDYDEDLMQDIAENAGGAYYYIEHPNQMARIFEQELKTLFTTVAKDVDFSFKATDAVENVQVLSFGAADNPDDTTFDMDNFYSGEKRTLLLRLEPSAAFYRKGVDTIDLSDVRFTYQNVLTQETMRFDAGISVTVTDDENAVIKASNHDVRVEANLFESERKHKEAIKQYEAGNYDVAEQQMADLEEELRTQNATLNDARLANKMEALRVEKEQMGAAQASAEDRSAYLKSTKQRLYKAQSGKRNLYLMQVGDKGYEVEQLQTALKNEGYYNGPIDGVFSDDVKKAVEAVQAAHALTVDGVAGPSTMQELGLY